MKWISLSLFTMFFLGLFIVLTVISNGSITGNVISGIAPRLYVAATYSFAFTASAAGGLTNSATFSINILQDATCITPTANICI